MPLANPVAMFTRPRVHISVSTAKLHERRSVAIVPVGEADCLDPRRVMGEPGRDWKFFTRSRVVDAVARGEMRWMDRHRNSAAFTSGQALTWQKTRSGLVHAMQLKSGSKGRYIPFSQRAHAAIPEQ